MMTESPILDVLSQQIMQSEVTSLSTPGELEAVVCFVAELGDAVLADPTMEAAAEELLALGALHPLPTVRRAIVQLAAAHAARPDARELLAWAVHDPDDAVALTAVSASVTNRIDEAVEPLYSITGRTSARIAGSLAGSTDRRQALSVLALGELAAHVGHGTEAARKLQGSILDRERIFRQSVDTSEMMFISGGSYEFGLREEQVSLMPGWFPVDDLFPCTTHEVGDYYIDLRPVTNAEYDAFVAEIPDVGHVWCHADEPPYVDHSRSTLFDGRFEPDDPATGVSWYDAYAYASSRGKILPTDLQWERAARGPDGALYPWGDAFDSAACNWLAVTLGRDVPTREAWLDDIRAIEISPPSRVTRPSSSFIRNRSSEGVEDTVGNVWEWTRSRYLDGADVDPKFRGLEPIQYLGDWSASVCVKGGSWASIAEQLLPSYRGRRHILARGDEAGFRCAYQIQASS